MILGVATRFLGMALIFGLLSACGSGGDSGNDNSSTDTTRPVAISVKANSPDGTYKAGDQISLTVTFSETVFVTGTPRLLLEDSIFDDAYYSSGSRSNELVFIYTVMVDQKSSDLEYYTSTQLILSSGTIQDAVGNDASYELPPVGSVGSLSANSNLVVDGNSPFVREVAAGSQSGTYFEGDIVVVNVIFNEPVVVTGTPQLHLETGDVDSVATYARGSGTNTLEFDYVVGVTDTSSHLRYIDNDALSLSGASVTDVAGNRASSYSRTFGDESYLWLEPPTWAALYENALLLINPYVGPIDTAYGQHGRAISSGEQYLPPNTSAAGFAKQGDKTLMCSFGIKISGGEEIACTRFTFDGELDNTYGNSGRFVFVQTAPKVSKLALQSDGKMVIGGNDSYSLIPSSSDRVCRFSTEGILDTSFGSAGCIAEFQYLTAITVLSDDKILIASSSSKISRYMKDGSPDSTFGSNNTNYITLASSYRIQSFDIQLDGKIIVVGFSGGLYTMNAVIARYMPDGLIDTSFGTNGLTSIVLTGLGNEEFRDVKVMSDGSIVAVGVSNYQYLISKFTSQGILDSSFDLDGICVTNPVGSNSAAERIFPETNIGFYVAGLSQSSMVVMKYLQ